MSRSMSLMCFHSKEITKVRLLLKVIYPDGYPDVPPELSLEVLDGILDDRESDGLMGELTTISEENIGMAMTFTLISHIREKLLALLQFRVERKRREAVEKERLEIEVLLSYDYTPLLILYRLRKLAREGRQ